MSFVARPPLLLGQGTQGPLRSQLKRLAEDFWRILWQPLVPFNPRPEPPDNPPSRRTIPDQQLEQCKALYEGTEADRNFLEGKARATFSVITFLVPLLASAVVFLFAHTSVHTGSRTVALIFISISFAFLILGFISIVRAVSVQVRETLGLGSIINLQAGRLRQYDKIFHARGMLYCASVNAAMNGHIAQFVKGAHILTALAVIALLIAAMGSISLLPSDPGPAKTQIVGSVSIASPALSDLKTEIEKLRDSLASDDSFRRRVDTLSSKIDQFAASLRELQGELERLRIGSGGQGTSVKP
jgi:hypothetical protein